MLSAAARIARVGVMVPGAEDAAAVVAGRDTAAPADDWFDAVRHLGRRGWKYQSPAVRYLVAASRLAVTGDELTGLEHPAGGVSIGTHDSVGRLHRQFDDALRAEGIRGLSPAELPGFSVNTPASHLAVAYDLHGFCLTLTNPLTAGLEALLHGVTALRGGTVTRVLSGATEDTDPAGRIRPGACAVLLTAAADAAGAIVTGGSTAFLPTPTGPDTASPLDTASPPDTASPDAARPNAVRPPNSVVARVADRVADAVPQPAPGTPFGFVFCAPPGPHELDRAIRERLEARGVPVQPQRYLGGAGEFGTVSPLLQLAGLLTDFGSGLVVAADPLGPVAAVSFTRTPDAPTHP